MVEREERRYGLTGAKGQGEFKRQLGVKKRGNKGKYKSKERTGESAERQEMSREYIV